MTKYMPIASHTYNDVILLRLFLLIVFQGISLHSLQGISSQISYLFSFPSTGGQGGLLYSLDRILKTAE